MNIDQIRQSCQQFADALAEAYREQSAQEALEQLSRAARQT